MSKDEIYSVVDSGVINPVIYGYLERAVEAAGFDVDVWFQLESGLRYALDNYFAEEAAEYACRHC